MINLRLFDQYNIDTNKNLKIQSRCPRPFDTVLIDKSGSCYACECTSWLPQSIGNLNIMPLQDILLSPMVEMLQESIKDGSYRYCNSSRCSYLLDTRQDKNDQWPKKLAERKIVNIRLAIDDSCNLRCPSCRTKKIFQSDKSQLRKKYKLADKIIEYIEKQNHKIKIHVGSDGDPFASLVYRYFIKRASTLENVTFTIQTNGLLVKKMHHKNKNLFQKLKVLNISIDGATKQTYESLRIGGNFEKIIENLQYIKELKSEFNFDLILHYVVQTKNYAEMCEMVKLAEDYCADRLWFNRITDWNTYANFTAEDVLDQSHPLHKDYLETERQVRQLSASAKTLIEMPTLIK